MEIFIVECRKENMSKFDISVILAVVHNTIMEF